MLTASLFNFLRQRQTSPTVNKSFKDHYCGCGLIFQEAQQFKEHVLGMHGGVFVPHSSHFLAYLSKVVLPCKCWDPSVMDQPKDNCQPLPQQPPSSSPILRQPQINQKRPRGRPPGRPNNKTISAKAQRHKHDEQDKEDRQMNLPPKAALMSQKNITWNGFLLKPNKPRQKNGFFCGNCSIAFEEPEGFLTHCFEECQQLEHPEASHHIFLDNNREVRPKATENLLTQASEWTQMLNSGFMMRLSDKPGIVEIRSNTKHFSSVELPENMVNIFDLLVRAGNNRNKPTGEIKFFCGCGVTTGGDPQTNATLFHILRTHKQIVPKGSSHIFLQQNSSLSSKRFALLAVDPAEEGLGWCCPCKMTVNMSKREFIKHVQTVHKGISPAYKIPHFTYKH